MFPDDNNELQKVKKTQDSTYKMMGALLSFIYKQRSQLNLFSIIMTDPPKYGNSSLCS